MTPADVETVVRGYGRELVAIAEEAIAHRLVTGRPWVPALDDLPDALRDRGAAFVTLERGAELLGCVGTLAAAHPLGITVATFAQEAAFADPRFPPLDPDAFAVMTIGVSVLSDLEPVRAGSFTDLVTALRPGVDGVLVEAAGARGTLLPAVWRKLPDPEDFADALWAKAGLPPRAWVRGVHVFRYESAEAHGTPPRAPLADRVYA